MLVMQRASAPTPIRLADTIVEDLYDPVEFNAGGTIPKFVQVTAQRLESGRWLMVLWGSESEGLPLAEVTE